MTSPALDVELLRRRDPAMTERFMAVLRRFARRYFRTRAEAESVALAAITELFIKLERGDEPAEAKLWAMTAASNAVKRQLTQQRRAGLGFRSELHTDPRAPTLEEIQRCRELLRTIDGLLEQMPEALARALIATGVEGRTTASVARELGVKAATLRKDLSRGRGFLRRKLSDQDKLDRLRELAREARRQREATRGHQSSPPWFARPLERDEESSRSDG